MLKQNVSSLKLRYQMDGSPLPNPAMHWNALQDTSLSKISCFQEAFFKLPKRRILVDDAHSIWLHHVGLLLLRSVKVETWSIAIDTLVNGVSTNEWKSIIDRQWHGAWTLVIWRRGWGEGLRNRAVHTKEYIHRAESSSKVPGTVTPLLLVSSKRGSSYRSLPGKTPKLDLPVLVHQRTWQMTPDCKQGGTSGVWGLCCITGGVWTWPVYLLSFVSTHPAPPSSSAPPHPIHSIKCHDIFQACSI